MSNVYLHTNSIGQAYHLNTQEVTLKGGRVQRIYFFSKDERDTACPLPADREVIENPRTHLPILRRIKAGV